MSDLSEHDGEDGVRPAARVVHVGGGGGSVGVASLHQLLDLAVVHDDVLRQV